MLVLDRVLHPPRWEGFLSQGFAALPDFSSSWQVAVKVVHPQAHNWLAIAVESKPSQALENRLQQGIFLRTDCFAVQIFFLGAACCAGGPEGALHAFAEQEFQVLKKESDGKRFRSIRSQTKDH